MKTASFQYYLGTELDGKVLNKVTQLKQINKLQVWEAKFGEVVVHIFSSGEMRAFVPGQDLDNLQPVLLSAAVKIIELLQSLKKAGVNFDEQKVLSEGHPMPFDYISPSGVRPNFKGVNINLLREVIYASYDVSQEFQIQRNFVQAGENAGRRIATESKAKDVKALNKTLVEYMKNSGIGLAKFSEEKIERSTYPAQLLKLEESAFAAGMPVINKPYCHFVRALLRGAYVVFYELENVDVKEENCWGLGDDFCQFRAAIFPK